MVGGELGCMVRALDLKGVNALLETVAKEYDRNVAESLGKR